MTGAGVRRSATRGASTRGAGIGAGKLGEIGNRVGQAARRGRRSGSAYTVKSKLLLLRLTMTVAARPEAVVSAFKQGLGSLSTPGSDVHRGARSTRSRHYGHRFSFPGATVTEDAFRAHSLWAKSHLWC